MSINRVKQAEYDPEKVIQPPATISPHTRQLSSEIVPTRQKSSEMVFLPTRPRSSEVVFSPTRPQSSEVVFPPTRPQSSEIAFFPTRPHSAEMVVPPTHQSPSEMVTTTQPALLIPNNNLINCSYHFKASDINKLVGILDDNNQLHLKDIAQQYDDTQTKAYRVLKKWLEAHPNTTKEELQEKLKLMRFTKAAER